MQSLYHSGPMLAEIPGHRDEIGRGQIVDGRGVRGPGADQRLLMICIDSMSLPFLRAHLDQLPTFKAQMDRGLLAEPETPGDFFSAGVWATFVSEKPPGEHGQYFPLQWNAEHQAFKRFSKPLWRGAFEVEPFWYALARAGVDCTVLDAAAVLNDQEAPCRQISNWSYQSTGRASTSNPALLAEIRRRFGRRPMGNEVPVPKKRALCRKVRDDMIVAIERKTNAILWLMERDPWQFFLAGYHEIHRAGHNLWPIEGAFASEADSDAMLAVYKIQDQQLQRIVEHIDAKTTLVLFALHGMAPNIAQDHFLQEIMAKLNARYLADHGYGNVPVKSTNLFSQLRKSVPFELQYHLAGILGEDIQDWVVSRSLVGGFDWSRTPAFRLSSGGEGMIRLNIKGREAKGFFEPDGEDMAKYVDWLMQRLFAIRVAGTDRPLIKSVDRTKDLFSGKNAHYLPDLLLKWAPDSPAEQIYSDDIGTIRSRLRTGRGGNHVGGSFVLVCGPGAKPESVREIAHIKDMGAFVRSHFGMPATASH